MKANEAPERIYVHIKKGKALNTWNNEWIGVNDIEYTRTDVFIGKAVEWLRCHPSSYYDDLEEFSNVFRKAMKVE